MTVNGGDVIFAADINRATNRRIGTTTRTSDTSASSGTTELQVDTVTGTTVTGRRYRIRWQPLYTGTVLADRFFFIIREGSGLLGTQLAFTTLIVDASGTPTESLILECDYTATSSGSQTWTVSIRRNSGTGTMTVKGSATGPSSLIVDSAE